jgi:hypothetical protein
VDENGVKAVYLSRQELIVFGWDSIQAGAIFAQARLTTLRSVLVEKNFSDLQQWLWEG